MSLVDVWSAIRPLFSLIVDAGPPYMEWPTALLQAVDCRPIIYINGSDTTILTRRACACRIILPQSNCRGRDDHR